MRKLIFSFIAGAAVLSMPLSRASADESSEKTKRQPGNLNRKSTRTSRRSTFWMPCVTSSFRPRRKGPVMAA